MKKQLLFVPSIIFFFILLVFFYLLTIDRDPKQIPSILIEKKVPDFETQSLLNNRKFISSPDFKYNTYFFTNNSLHNAYTFDSDACWDDYLYFNYFFNEI